jgi:hypothetical protein
MQSRAARASGLAGRDEIDEENRHLLRRQKGFRAAAEYVAAAFERLEPVQKVVLFGSVGRPLEKGIPRFRKLRRAGVALWQDCKDVDFAVWVRDALDLEALQNTRSRALNDLSHETGTSVAHHQVDVFLFEPETDRYRGRLCCFGVCPKGNPSAESKAAALAIRSRRAAATRGTRGGPRRASLRGLDRLGIAGQPGILEPDAEAVPHAIGLRELEGGGPHLGMEQDEHRGVHQILGTLGLHLEGQEGIERHHPQVHVAAFERDPATLPVDGHERRNDVKRNSFQDATKAKEVALDDVAAVKTGPHSALPQAPLDLRQG